MSLCIADPSGRVRHVEEGSGERSCRVEFGSEHHGGVHGVRVRTNLITNFEIRFSMWYFFEKDAFRKGSPMALDLV